MNRDIAQYVLRLGNRVTPRQHQVLLVLACHHQIARETYWPSREKLAAELSMDESQLRRIVNDLEAAGILRQVPGNGSGNHSGYIFLEFEKGDVKGDFSRPEKGDKKGDFFDPAIRNYKIFTESKALEPTKPFTKSGGGETLASSSDPIVDDDAGRVPQHDRNKLDYEAETPEVERVLRAFEESPLTKRKASAADRQIACDLLRVYHVEQIEYGILLAGARRLSSALSPEGQVTGSEIQSMAYFKRAIDEIASDPMGQYTPSYADHARQFIKRYAKKLPQSEIA
jgi:hypothetical protein